MAIDEVRLEAFMRRFAADLGAALHASTVVLGDELGLYRALADNGPTDAATVASATGCDARLVQAWLDAQWISGYCHFSAQTATYWLSPEQAAVLTDPGSPAYLVGGMTVAASIPAVDDVAAKLAAGGSVADVGCGYGAASILLGHACPSARITGFDVDAASIDVARTRAADNGVADRVRFEVATPHDFPGTGYDLVCVFDAFSELADPGGAARHIRDVLAPDGTWLLVEPTAGEPVEDDIAGIAADAGFARFRVAQTPFNRVFELRP